MDAVATQTTLQKGIEVLLVEDSPTEAMLVIASLDESDNGSFQVVHAKSLTEAFRYLESRPFDVVVLDLTLPESSGLDTFTALHDRYPQVPVVILTANHSKDVALEMVRLGAQDYIIKEKVEDMQLALSLRYAITRKEAELRQVALMEELAAANGELERFAHVVSHDLQTPLRGIKTIVEWLVEDYADKLDDKGQEQMALMVNRIQRMQRLIDGIMAYSKAGGNREEVVEADLNAMLDSVIDLLAPPDIVTVTRENPFPTLVCEPTRLSQVFQNLVDNAVKYMDKPQGRITLGCTDQGDHWRFSVADNGPGIDPLQFQRIFELFTTLKSKDVCESTGVGLAVVKKIVESWGGRIWVESKKGLGSTFLFTLPKAQIPL